MHFAGGATDSHFEQVPATNFAIWYLAPLTGIVEMWFDGRRIATVANEGTECVPW